MFDCKESDQKLMSPHIVMWSGLLNLKRKSIYRTVFFDFLTQTRPPSSTFSASRMRKTRVSSVIRDTKENDVKHVSSSVTKFIKFSSIFAMIIIANNKWDIWAIHQA